MIASTSVDGYNRSESDDQSFSTHDADDLDGVGAGGRWSPVHDASMTKKSRVQDHVHSCVTQSRPKTVGL